MGIFLEIVLRRIIDLIISHLLKKYSPRKILKVIRLLIPESLRLVALLGGQVKGYGR